MKEIPIWMEKFIPAMIKQWSGDVEIGNISTKSDLVNYRDSLSDSIHGFPNKHTFDTNMNIKISLLEIINNDFEITSK